MADEPQQILVTNDDGIDSVGLHTLARAMLPFGQVTVVAPDREFSGSGAAIGAILDRPQEVHEAAIDGIETVWAVPGPPALCVMYASLGAFGFRPDLVVAGINPGANIGRSVYYSGTVGAALSARNFGIPGVAVSQAVNSSSVEGQAWGDVVANLNWESAATVAQQVAKGIVNSEQPDYGPGAAPVLNVNVPHLELDQIKGWAWTTVGALPRRAMTTIHLDPKPGHVGSHQVRWEYGEVNEPEPGTDTAMIRDRVSVTYLSGLTEVDNSETVTGKAIAAALNDLVP